MLTVCWSCKGGVGTTVVTALCALRIAQTHPTVAIGLDGDLGAALGIANHVDEAGFAEWLVAAADGAEADALSRIGHAASGNLSIVGPGSNLEMPSEGAIKKLTESPLHVVVDAGRVDQSDIAERLAEAGSTSLFVTRRCYLALRRANDLPVQPTGIVVVSERGRALVVSDVEAVVAAPVVADLAYDESLARNVDAGLLSTRLPRGLLGSLARVA